MNRMQFLVSHCPGSFSSKAHPGKRKALQVQTLEECALYHGGGLPNTSFDGQWAHSCSLEDGKASKKKSSHHLKLSTEGGGQFQGVGAMDAAMVVVVPNRLLRSKRVWSLRIPP
jgi:hypothetical protein